MSPRPDVEAFFDSKTHTVSYLVSQPGDNAAIIIDPVLDYDHASGRFDTRSAQAILASAHEKQLDIHWVLETHAHADHLSAAPFLKSQTCANVAIGEHITDVQTIFAPVFDAQDVSLTGAEFDCLLKDGDEISAGSMTIKAMHTPGHTPACMSYIIGDTIFVGDTLFMPDYGTARTDFPGGDARTLYRSIHKLLSMPDDTRLFMCHDYLPTEGRNTYAWETTVRAQREGNIHIGNEADVETFAAMRQSRDKSLPAPALLLPSVQVNIRAGQLPPKDANGETYLRIPVKPAAQCA